MLDNTRESFVYHLSWEEVLDKLPVEVREEVRGAIIGYARTGVASELKPLAQVAFTFCKRDMDRDYQKYQEMVAARRENGRKGAAAKQSKQDQAKQANAEFAKQSKQGQAKQADYDGDYDGDYDTQCVCVDSAQERAESTTTPHTGFDFFFPTFWKRNIIAPASETQRFIDHYEPAGWRLEKGDFLATDAARLAKARNWKPEIPGKRFPDGFIQAWEKLAQKAPEALRLQMYDDRVAVKMSGQDVSALVCASEVKAWIMGAGGQAAKVILIDGWLAGNDGKTLRILTYRK